MDVSHEFSLRAGDAVSEASGRGIGLDVVHNWLAAMSGSVFNSWLAQLMDDDAAPSGSRTGPPLPANPHEEEASGLNFRTAIEAHQQWKMRLHAVIESKSEEELDPERVSRDDRCELGQWIHGASARQFGSLPEFVDLRSKHAAFHLCAGRVLSLAQSGQPALAAAEMAPGGEFARISREVVGDLAAMFMRLKDVEIR